MLNASVAGVLASRAASTLGSSVMPGFRRPATTSDNASAPACAAPLVSEARDSSRDAMRTAAPGLVGTSRMVVVDELAAGRAVMHNACRLIPRGVRDVRFDRREQTTQQSVPPKQVSMSHPNRTNQRYFNSSTPSRTLSNVASSSDGQPRSCWSALSFLLCSSCLAWSARCWPSE
jgi:hypothetical protein